MKYNSTPNRAELDNSVSLPPIDLAAPFKYRAEATMARQHTETASSGNMRKLLLNDSKLWGLQAGINLRTEDRHERQRNCSAG